MPVEPFSQNPKSDNVWPAMETEEMYRAGVVCPRLHTYVLLPQRRVTSLARILLLSERDHGIYVNRSYARNRTSKQGNRRQNQNCHQIGEGVCRNRTKKE